MSLDSLLDTTKPYKMSILVPKRDEFGDYPELKNSKGKCSKIVFKSPSDCPDIAKINDKYLSILNKEKDKLKKDGKKVPASFINDLEDREFIEIALECATGFENMDGANGKPLAYSKKTLKKYLEGSKVLLNQVKLELNNAGNFMVG